MNILKFDFLQGKKTYIGAAALFVAGGLLAVGVIDQKMFEQLTVLIAAWTAVSLRKAMK